MSLDVQNTQAKTAAQSGDGELVLPQTERRGAEYTLSKVTLKFLEDQSFFDLNHPIAIEQIKVLHAFVCSSQYTDDGFHSDVTDRGTILIDNPVGRFRAGEYQNRVFNKLGVSADRIDDEVSGLVTRIHQTECGLPLRDPFRLAAESYLTLIDIHPFGDANVRTSRLLTNALLLRHGQSAIDVSLINWHDAKFIGFREIPQDREFLASVLKEAVRGVGTRGFSRYAHDDGSPVRELGIGEIFKASPTELLRFFRQYIGAAFPSLRTMKSLLDATPFTVDEMSEFVGILKAGLNHATHRDTRAELSEALEYFEPQANSLKSTRAQEYRAPESLKRHSFSGSNWE